MALKQTKLFIDGLIFRENHYGGIARTWEELIPKLHQLNLSISLLIPFISRTAIKSLTRYEKDLHIINDYFYWPRRYFDKIQTRSNLLKFLYSADKSRIFHSSYYSTVYSSQTIKFLTVYDMIFELFEEKTSKWGMQFILNKRKAIKNADKIICISNNTKLDLLKIYPDIPETKVDVVYLGVSKLNPNRTEISIDELSKIYNIDIRPKEYFLLVGKLGGYKNFDLVLELVSNKHSARKYKFLSIGYEKHSHYRVYCEQNFPKTFAFIDYVPSHELATLYKNAIGLIYPSLYEGFGLPILEAMINECPVACSFNSSLPEIGGDAAIYFDPNSTNELYDSLIKLLHLDRDAAVRKGLANSSKFSWDSTALNYLKLYNQFL